MAYLVFCYGGDMMLTIYLTGVLAYFLLNIYTTEYLKINNPEKFQICLKHGKNYFIVGASIASLLWFGALPYIMYKTIRKG